jgi:hypothetical protein
MRIKIKIIKKKKKILKDIWKKEKKKKMQYRFTIATCYIFLYIQNKIYYAHIESQVNKLYTEYILVFSWLGFCHSIISPWLTKTICIHELWQPACLLYTLSLQPTECEISSNLPTDPFLVSLTYITHPLLHPIHIYIIYLCIKIFSLDKLLCI